MSVAAVQEQSSQVLQARECIRDNQLYSRAGRTAFLVEKMQPLPARAQALNQEVQALFAQMKTPQTAASFQALNQKLTEKLTALQKVAPIFDDAKTLDKDLKKVNALLVMPLPLTEEDEAVLLRLQRICVNLAALQN